MQNVMSMTKANGWIMDDGAILVIGLGNPGTEYESTRHNAGFMMLDHFCAQTGSTISQSKFQGLFGTARINGHSVYLLKPQTYMNLSGKSVVSCMSFYHLPIESVIVIHDELDLPVGDVRVKIGGGSGGHNGLKSIMELTGHNDFARIRIGIGRPEHGDVVNYVLGKFPENEVESFSASLKIGTEALRTYISCGSQAAMRFCNGLYRAQKKEVEAHVGRA